MVNELSSRPTNIVVSDSDCGSVRTVFESLEDMDVCKCIVPMRHEGTLNSRRAASPLVWSGLSPRRTHFLSPNFCRQILSDKGYNIVTLPFHQTIWIFKSPKKWQP
ncbi:hypothetical protein TNCV_3335721 [Trichonephila clavipes]|nr:hypothetical protein TNCV_3335721 [Trichonephila clavipes]